MCLTLKAASELRASLKGGIIRPARGASPYSFSLGCRALNVCRAILVVGWLSTLVSGVFEVKAENSTSGIRSATSERSDGELEWLLGSLRDGPDSDADAKIAQKEIAAVYALPRSRLRTQAA